MLIFDIISLLDHNKLTYKLLRLDNIPTHPKEYVNIKYKRVDSENIERVHIITYAVIYDYFNLFKWMYCNDYWVFKEYMSDIFNSAAYYNRLHIIKWLYSIDDDYNFDAVNGAINMAARYGQFEMVKYLCLNNHDCVFYTASSAAEGGHLDIIKWLYDKMDLDIRDIYETAYIAERKGYLHILDWLKDMNLLV